MKELSIKDKANRYDKAIEIAKSKIKNDKDHILYEDDVIEIFPELKESEDEKMKKSIIYALRNGGFYNNDKTDEAIAWLEKQGEQKETLCDKCRKEHPSHFCQDITALGRCALEKQGEQKPINDTDEDIVEVIKNTSILDKIEPKFHEGDWVVSKLDGKARRISEVHYDEYNKYYIVEGNEYNIEEYDRLYHLWTIKDAKDGDVLCINNEVFIYEHKKQMYSIAVAHCFVDSAGGFRLDGEFGFLERGNSISPATKEQRDLLFSKMKESGYEWNEDKKELIKL